MPRPAQAAGPRRPGWPGPVRAAAIPTARPGGRARPGPTRTPSPPRSRGAAGPRPPGRRPGPRSSRRAAGAQPPALPPRPRSAASSPRPSRTAVAPGLSPVRPAADRPQVLPLVPAVADELAPLPVTDRDPADPEGSDVHGVRWPFVVERERLTGRVDAKRERPSAHENSIRLDDAAGPQRPAA